MPLHAFLFAASLLNAQDGFPATPAHRWANDGIALAIREGILPEYTNGMYRARLREMRSRYEAAVYAHGALSIQLDRTELALSGGTDLQRASMLRAKALVPFYRRAAKEFAAEDTQLEFKPDGQIDRLENLATQLDLGSPARDHLFRDVPVGHWAAKAVGDLRALNLLDGYPDGKFRG